MSEKKTNQKTTQKTKILISSEILELIRISKKTNKKTNQKTQNSYKFRNFGTYKDFKKKQTKKQIKKHKILISSEILELIRMSEKKTNKKTTQKTKIPYKFQNFGTYKDFTFGHVCV